MQLNIIHPMLFAVAVTSPVSCAALKPLLADTLADLGSQAGGRLLEAIQDLDVKGLAKQQACGIYIARGRELAEGNWSGDWQHFAHLFETKPDAAADLQYCRGELESLGVEIVTKAWESGAATAVCGKVLLPQGFEGRSVETQAATCLHEYSHVLSQKRIGCKPWLANYALASSRMANEGTAYALSDALMERYGIPLKDIEASAKRRAERFPESYMLTHVVESECVADYFKSIRRELRSRAGV